MRLLLDTVAIIRWLEASPLLSAEARDAITEAPEVYVSAVSAVEIAAKTAIGKLRTPDDFAERVAEKSMIEPPLTIRHGLVMRTLPLHHRDPFDRMLIAQARCEIDGAAHRGRLGARHPGPRQRVARGAGALRRGSDHGARGAAGHRDGA